MKAEKVDIANRLRLQAETWRQAARIAESEESPLAAEFWNHACQRIARQLEAHAARLELESVDWSAAPERLLRASPPCRTSVTRCRFRRSF